MEQLKLGEILAFAKSLKEDGMTDKEINALPVYIGDDDELNGVHCAWDTSILDADDKDEDVEYIIDMIGIKSGKAILIS